VKAVFRVDASLAIGTGHVMRCLTMAQVLKDNGYSVEFICRLHDGNLVNKVRSSGFNVYELKLFEEFELDNKLVHSNWLGATQQQDANDCINIIEHSQIDLLIVDHYSLGEQWENKLSSYCEKLMVIDDLADRKHKCDVLLDQTFGRKEEDYLIFTPKNCKLLLGSQYALLRPEFYKWRWYSLKRRIKPKFRKLLVNMGGVDIDNVTESVIDELEACNLPTDLHIVVVLGSLNPHFDSIKSKIYKLPYKTEVKVDIDNIVEIMANSDIAIGASGSTTWERCCLGLPTIQIIIAKNQQFSAEMLAYKNIVKLVKEVKEISYLLENSNEWIGGTGITASKICDGMGSYKVFNKIAYYKINLEKFGEVYLYNYASLNKEEQKQILSMRNHPEIKRWMYNNKNISDLTHFEFVKSLKENVYKRYFLVKQKDKIVGSINFLILKDGDEAIFGFYSNPFEQIIGSGRILESASLHYAFNELNISKLTLEVFSDNKQVINLHKKNGFRITNKREYNGKEVVCMEKIKVLG